MNCNCNNGMCGNNNLVWLIILLILFGGCGGCNFGCCGGGYNSGCNCGGCGCDHNCC